MVLLASGLDLLALQSVNMENQRKIFMGLQEIMAYLPKLSEKELQQLQLEVDRLSGSYAHHGVSDDQWAIVKETAALLEAGIMKTRPGREVVAELLKKYQ